MVNVTGYYRKEQQEEPHSPMSTYNVAYAGYRRGDVLLLKWLLHLLLVVRNGRTEHLKYSIPLAHAPGHSMYT